jgi:hypothetical protein
LALILAVTLAVPAVAAAYTSPTWNLNGTYTLDLTCTSGCSGDYVHSMTITATSDVSGAVSGTGFYDAIPGYTWTVTGQVTGWDVTFHVLYTGLNAGYTVDLAGAINQYGGMAGSATSSAGQAFTWKTTSGSVGLFSDSCEYGTVAGYTKVWDGFVPANGNVVTTPTLDPGRTWKMEASGTYFAGGSGLFDIQADAEYSQDAYQRANDLPWTDSVRNYESYGSGLLDLKVNGAFVNWGAYNASHRYVIPVTPMGSPLEISANIYDIASYNNTGGLCVALYADEIPTGEIVSPADGATYELGDDLAIEANYYDDNPGSAVFWAVRVDENTSCSNVGDNQVWANVDGDHDPYTWLNITGGKQLLSTAPTTGWEGGDYCFVFNPGGGDSVPSGESDVRLISRFTLADTTDPVITFESALPAPNGDGWNKDAVTLTWSCTDAGSSVVDATVTKTLNTEGASQSATGTCEDSAGNTASDTQSGINIDLTAPGITWNGGIADGDSFIFGSVPAEPTCDATDALSGPKSCVVEGYGLERGPHILTATAYDLAGNKTVETRSYTVAAWTLTGFYQPVEMGGIYNVVKGGQTVPLKFEVFAGMTELTDIAVVKSFTTSRIVCPDGSGVTEDELLVTTTGATSLRYDTTDGQFIQNWKTPKTSGVCYRATMTTQDESSLVAFFKTK